LHIPGINVASSLSKLGYNPDGTVEVPTDPDQPGWFRRGPSPGQRGSAVILGHVDSRRGPAVFFRLGALRRGDRVSVRLADGAVARFAVVSVAIYPKSRFPARRVYGPRKYSALQLVTCGGKFDRSTGHYRSNVVAYTRLVATSHTKAVRR
jgi:sortase (surface protein transpeptidase)